MEIAFIIGRILLGGYFIMFGFMHFGKTAMLSEMARKRGLPTAKSLTLLTGILLLLAGLGILLAVYVKWAIIGLVVFLVLAAFMIHHFWTDEGSERMAQMVHFMSNIAIAGALLMLLSMSEPWVYSVL